MCYVDLITSLTALANFLLMSFNLSEFTVAKPVAELLITLFSKIVEFVKNH